MWSKATLLILSISILLVSCRSTELKESQIQIHQSMAKAMDDSLDSTLNTAARFAQELKTEFDKSTHCTLPSEKEGFSSVYYPRDAKRGERTNCFVAATKKLEPKWHDLYEKSGFISWIYSFDSHSKVKRILPAANTKVLFGDNLIFDTFSFYRDAVASYPNPTWTRVKEDINGTGRIVIATQAVKLKDSERYAVVSIDLRINQILKDRYATLQSFSVDNRLEHIFVYSFYEDISGKTLVSEFSTDLSLWAQLKPKNNSVLNLLPEEEVSLRELSQSASQSVGQSFSKEMRLQGKSYFCTMSRSKAMPVFLLLCSM